MPVFVFECQVFLVYGDNFLAGKARVSELFIVAFDAVGMCIFVHESTPVQALVALPTAEVLVLIVGCYLIVGYYLETPFMKERSLSQKIFGVF